jgi:hypothetical protein
MVVLRENPVCSEIAPDLPADTLTVALLLRLLADLRFEPGAVVLALDDQVVRVAGEAVDGGLSADGIGERGEPLVGGEPLRKRVEQAPQLEAAEG